MTTATVTQHKSVIWFVECGKIIVLHVQHAFSCNVLTKSTKRRREIFIPEVLTTTRARGKSFILCLYMKTIGAKQSTFRQICTKWPTQNNLKTFNPTQRFNLMQRFRSRSRPNFVNSLLLFIIIIYLFITIIIYYLRERRVQTRWNLRYQTYRTTGQ